MTGEVRTVFEANGLPDLFDHVVEGFFEGFRQSEALLAGTILASGLVQPTPVNDCSCVQVDEPE